MNLDSIKSKLASIKSKISGKLKRAKKKIPTSKIEVEKRMMYDIFREFSPRKIIENPRFAILGIGNDLKGDDGVGWYVVDKLREEFEKDENLLIVKTSVPENHVKEISDFAPRMLIIVDAADFKKSPGKIKSIKGYEISKSFVSTHTTPLTLFLRLYQKGEPIKKHIVLIGIQRGNNEFGQPLSRPAKRAGDKLIKLITRLYKNGVLDLSLERELEYLSNPFQKVRDYFKSE